MKKTLLCLLCASFIPSIVMAEDSRLLFSETFTNTAPGTANQNVAAIGWQAYGGPEALDLSNATRGELNSVMIAAVPGNPSDSKGCLALIMSNSRPSWPVYAVVKTGIEIREPSAISWRLHGAPGSTVRVRLLVQIGERWYASDISDTNKEYYEPALQGTAADFADAETKAVTKTLIFSRDALDWRSLALEPGKVLKLGDTIAEDLPASGLITGIGFYVIGGNTGRVDTLEIR